MDKNDVLNALKANKASRTGTRLSTSKKYEIHTDGDLTAVLPPQALLLLEIMFNADVETWTEAELYDLFSGHTEISEKQTPWKIWQYYRPRLIEAAFVTEAK